MNVFKPRFFEPWSVSVIHEHQISRCENKDECKYILKPGPPSQMRIPHEGQMLDRLSHRLIGILVKFETFRIKLKKRKK